MVFVHHLRRRSERPLDRLLLPTIFGNHLSPKRGEFESKFGPNLRANAQRERRTARAQHNSTRSRSRTLARPYSHRQQKFGRRRSHTR